VTSDTNPEFLREGAAIHDFKHPDRIIIGTEDEHAKKAAAEIYRPLYLNQAPIPYTSRRTAELIKYAANAFLATKITFINEIADLRGKTVAVLGLTFKPNTDDVREAPSIPPITALQGHGRQGARL
jgi:UDP-glucose 6-dehydrogenase